jgi:hypothetical protein
MTVEIVVYLSADTKAKEFFAYLDDELGRKEYDALASAFRTLVSLQTEQKFHKLTLEAGGEWLVRLDALQAIELRNYNEVGIQHRIAVETDHAKRGNRIDKAVKGRAPKAWVSGRKSVRANGGHGCDQSRGPSVSGCH